MTQKSTQEIAGDIVIAWIKARADINVGKMAGAADSGLPTAEEVAVYYKTVFNMVHNPFEK